MSITDKAAMETAETPRDIESPAASRFHFPRIHHAWVVVMVGLLVYFIQSGIGGYITGVLQTAWLKEFGWPTVWLSFVFSAGSLLPGLTGVTIGRWTDKYGPRWVLLSGAALSGLCYVLLSTVNSYPMFCFAFAIGALGRCGLSNIPVSTTIVRWFAKRRARGLGLASTGISLAGVVLVPVTTYLVVNFGWRVAVLALGFSVWILLLPAIWFVMAGTPEELGIPPYGQELEETDRLPDPAKTVDLGKVRRNPTFWLIAAGQMLAGSTSATIGIHAPLAILDKGGTPVEAAAALSLLASCSLLARFSSAWIVDALPAAPTLGFMYLAQATGFALLALSAPGLGIWLFAIIFGLALGSTLALQSTVVAEVFGVVGYGTILGAITMTVSLMSAAAPIYAAWMRDVTGSYTIAYLTFTATAIVGGCCLFVANRREKRLAAARAV